MTTIDPSLLQSLVDYNPRTGEMTWRARDPSMFIAPGNKGIEAVRDTWNKKHAGQPAFNTKGTGGYLTGRLFRTRLSAHRVAFAIIHGRWPKGVVDHINGETTDNRAVNLREVTHAINSQNCRRRTDNKSGKPGVFSSGGVYRAEICAAGKRMHLGRFKTIEEAIAARKAAEMELGFHENHGR